MFDVAIWTDTLGEESVNGTSGFNFQSISAGVTSTDQYFMKNNMLFQRRMDWSASRELDHPVSFSFCVADDGRMYLSRGIPTGLTNNGRPGNSLTQIIVSSDPEDFGSEVPAQLFGANNWSLKKADSKESSPWITPLDISEEFEVSGLHEFLCKDAFISQNLSKIVSMLSESSKHQKKTIIYSKCATRAEKLIAAVSLLLPRSAAFQMSIRGLVPEPFTTKADVVVASPEFGNLPERSMVETVSHFIDIDENSISEVDIPESTRIKSEWFLNQGEQGLAAISALSSWERILGSEFSIPAVELAVFGQLSDSDSGDRRWEIAMRTLEELSIAGSESSLFSYGDALTDIVLNCEIVPTADRVSTSARVICALYDANFQDLSILLLPSVLEVAVRSPELSRAFAAELTPLISDPGFPWEDEKKQQVSNDHIEQLMRECELDVLWPLLTVGRASGIKFNGQAREEISDRLARWWSRNPRVVSPDDNRIIYPETVDHLPKQLAIACSENEAVAYESLANGTWDWLLEASPRAYRQYLAPWKYGLEIANVDSKEEICRRLERSEQLPGSILLLLAKKHDLAKNPQILHSWISSQHSISKEADTTLVEQLLGLMQRKTDCRELDQLFAHMSQTTLTKAPGIQKMVADAGFAKNCVMRWEKLSSSRTPTQGTKQTQRTGTYPGGYKHPNDLWGFSALEINDKEAEIISLFISLWPEKVTTIVLSTRKDIAEEIIRIHPSKVRNILLRNFKSALNADEMAAYLNWVAEIDSRNHPNLYKVARDYFGLVEDSRTDRKLAMELLQAGELSPKAAEMVTEIGSGAKVATRKWAGKLGFGVRRRK